jgi:MoaA/NifB/PqqE/SkfB family radical SAM enzyme
MLKIKMLFKGIYGFYVLNIKRDPNGFFPPILSIKLTDRCNYRCITCEHYKIGNKSEELNLIQWKKLIDEFEKLGGISIRFTGGSHF